jgi:hypothetical protein
MPFPRRLEQRDLQQVLGAGVAAYEDVRQP